MNSVKSVISNFESFFDSDKVEVLLYGDSRLDNIKNKYMLEATLNYTKNSERFSGSFVLLIVSTFTLSFTTNAFYF